MSQLGIFESIRKVMSDLSPVDKDQTNAQQGFNFRSIDSVYNMLQPIMAKHGVITVPNITGIEQKEVQSSRGASGVHVIVRYKWIFYAVDGSFITAETIGEAIDYGDKAFNKACSIAHKYALLTVFSIPTKELEDPDKDSHDLKPKAKKQEEKITQNYGKPEDFKMPFGKTKGKHLRELSTDELKKILEWCREKKMTGDIVACLEGTIMQRVNNDIAKEQVQ